MRFCEATCNGAKARRPAQRSHSLAVHDLLPAEARQEEGDLFNHCEGGGLVAAYIYIYMQHCKRRHATGTVKSLMVPPWCRWGLRRAHVSDGTKRGARPRGMCNRAHDWRTTGDPSPWGWKASTTQVGGGGMG